MSTLEKSLYKRVSAGKNVEVGGNNAVYKGFSTVSENTENFALYDLELIKQDLINHFHIRQGEKFSDPTFGTIIWDVLYEPFTESIKNAIVQNVTEIVNYDPRIQVEQIQVDTYESGIEILCVLTYVKYNISEELRFQFDQSLNPIE